MSDRLRGIRAWSRRRRPVIIVAGIVAVAAFLGLWWSNYTSDRDKTATGTQAKQLAEQIKLVCAQGSDAAKELGAACSQASKVAESPVVGETSSIPVVTYKVITPGPTTTVTFIRVTVSPGKAKPGPTTTDTIITPGPTTTETTTEPGSTSTMTVTVTKTETSTGEPTDTTTTTVTTTAPGPTETTTEPGPTTTKTTTPTCVIGIAC